MNSRVSLEILSGAIRSHELPQTLDLSELAAGMEELWKKSIAGLAKGVVREYAATIVLDKKCRLKLVNKVRGLAYDVEPNLQVRKGMTFIGTFHTHPRTDEHLPMPFSESDFVCAIRYGERLSVLRSAETVWALVRTAETVADVNQLELRDQFFATREEMFSRAGSILEAIREANIMLCHLCKFTLYEGGTDGVLGEVFRP